MNSPQWTVLSALLIYICIQLTMINWTLRSWHEESKARKAGKP